MRSTLPGLLLASLAVVGCTPDITDLELVKSPGWDWTSRPLATGGGWEPNCEDSFVECTTTAAVDCTATPTRGGYIQCELTILGITNYTTVNAGSWKFEGGGHEIPGPDGDLFHEWGGTAVVEGTVSIPVTINGVPVDPTPSATFNVDARSWTWSVSGSAGSSGVIDGCMGSGDGGLTASLNCTASTVGKLFYPSSISSGNGYTATEVDGGPNDGLWFVTSPTVTMNLRTELNREYRSDGTAYAVAGGPVSAVCQAAFGNTNARSHYEVNQLCTSTAKFAECVSDVWAHEADHLSAALTAAQSSSNDVHKLIEGLFSDTQSSLNSAVAGEFGDANDRVYGSAIATHVGQETLYTPIWVNSGAGWSFGGLYAWTN